MRPPSVLALPSSAQSAVVATQEVHLLDLPGVRRLFDTLARARRSMSDGEETGAWTEFTLLAAAVVGDRSLEALTFDELQRSDTARGPLVRATAGITTRDKTAYDLQGLGYSARETADVVSGRISLEALDTAVKMLMIGRGKEAAANYLDDQYRRVEASKLPPPDAPPRPMPDSIDAVIVKYAGLRGLDPAIVHAIVAVESAYDAGARSKSGAIGLMQLMPATARALGVDPWNPEQNIAGGVRYFSELLGMFNRLELALVAYNGGPEFARRYARGQTALYGETRNYVKQVLLAYSKNGSAR